MPDVGVLKRRFYGGGGEYNFLLQAYQQGVTADKLIALISPAPGSASFKKANIAVLAAGSVVVAESLVTANSLIFVTPQNGAANIGSVWVSGRVVGVSFTITSSNALDTRQVAWSLWELNP